MLRYSELCKSSKFDGTINIFKEVMLIQIRGPHWLQDIYFFLIIHTI